MKKEIQKYLRLSFLSGTLLLGLVLSGCSKTPSIKTEVLGNGYSCETEPIDKKTSKWRLFLLEDENKRLVTEAIVVDGEIQTMLPTPFAWGCTGHGYKESEYLATVSCGAIGDVPAVLNLNIDDSGQLTSREKLFSTKMLDLYTDSMYSGKLVVVVEMETPIKLEYVQKMVKQFVSRSQLRGLVFLPKVENLSKPELEPPPPPPIEDDDSLKPGKGQK